jgi:hypothetical protein
MDANQAIFNLLFTPRHFQDLGFERGITSQSFSEDMTLFACPQEAIRFSTALFRPSSASDCIFV